MPAGFCAYFCPHNAKSIRNLAISDALLVAGVGFEPHDLRVMSPTSYQAALPRGIGAGNRDRTGTILSYHGILSPGRLPVPPFRRGLPRTLVECLYSIPRVWRFVKGIGEKSWEFFSTGFAIPQFMRSAGYGCGRGCGGGSSDNGRPGAG